MKEHKNLAKNDYLIEEIIKSPYFKFFPNGTVFSRFARTGKLFANKNKWRQIGNINHGYIRFMYKRKHVRILWRKKL